MREVAQGKMNFCENFFRVFPIDKVFLKRVDETLDFLRQSQNPDFFGVVAADVRRRKLIATEVRLLTSAATALCNLT